MDFRNKWIVGTIRTLFGLMMLASGVFGLLSGRSPEGVPPALVPIIETLWDTGIMQMVRITEIAAGLMLTLNFLPALAAVFIAPVSVGIIVFQAMQAPEFLPIGIVIAIINVYLGYAYWDRYTMLFKLGHKK